MGTKHRGSRRERRALDVFIKLVRATEAVARRSGLEIARAGLTESQFGVLEALYHLGPMCQRELGSKTLKSGGNITLVVDNLERRGLVRRRRSPEDRRFITVSLTAEGKRLMADLFPRHAARVADEIGALTAGEQKELDRLLKKLGLGRAGR